MQYRYNHISLPPLVARCPHCQQDQPAVRILTITDHAQPGSSVVWHGCYACLERANRQDTAPASLSPFTAAILRAAKRAITEPVEADEIDAVCAAIDGALRGKG